MRIIMGILCIGLPEVIGWRGNDKVDASVRDAGEYTPCVPADNLVCEGKECRGFIRAGGVLASFEPFLILAFPFLSRTFSSFIADFPGYKLPLMSKRVT
jgi:hypothetical protein